MQETQNAHKSTLLALLGYVALVLVMTWPVAARLGSQLAGGRDDLWVHQWNLWWIKQALTQGLNPFQTPFLYFPNGAALTSHNIAWFNTALWLPLQALFDHIAAYNLIFMAVFALNGFCMYLFAREILPSAPAAFTAGLIYAFWPYTMSHFDHTNMMVVFWVPLVLLFVGRTLRRRRLRDAVLAGLCLALLGITRWQLVVMSAPILAAYVGYLLLTDAAVRTRRAAGLLLAAGALAVVLMAPLAAPLLVDQFTRDYPQDTLLDERVYGRTDLLAYATPSIHSDLWGDRFTARYANFTVNQFYTPYLGLIALALALLGVLRRWHQSWLWLLLALGYVLLALSPELGINGVSYPAVPMPARLIDDTLFYQVVRRPDRFNIFLSLPIAMLAGWGFAVVGDWLRQRAPKPMAVGVLGGLALLILLEYTAVPFTTTPITIPAWERARAGDPTATATLDLPINDRSYDKWYMLYQTAHAKPIATGHVSRMPRETYAFLDSTPFLRLLRTENLMDPAITDVSRQLDVLADAGVGQIVLHKTFANPGLLAIWQDWLTVQPRHADDDVIVYATAPEFGRDFRWDHDLGSELGLIRATAAPQETVQQGVVKVDARWGGRAAPGQNLQACLQLVGADSRAAQTQCQPVSAGWPTAEWPANAVARAGYALSIAPELPPGSYDLALGLMDENGAAVGETAVITSVTIRSFQPQTASSATWDNGITLRGYDLDQTAAAIALTLYWQSPTRLPTGYKVFVHLTDPASGEIVAQSDAIPRGWSYPTTGWEPGEIVDDTVTLPLDGVAPGRYALRVGLYDQLTGARASVRGGDFLPLTEVDHQP